MSPLKKNDKLVHNSAIVKAISYASNLRLSYDHWSHTRSETPTMMLRQAFRYSTLQGQMHIKELILPD